MWFDFVSFSLSLDSASSSSNILSLFKPSRILDLYLFLWFIEIYKQKKEALRHRGTQWSILTYPLIKIERLIQESPRAWDQNACVLPH